MLDTGDAMIRVPEEVASIIPANKRKSTFGEGLFTCDDFQWYIPIVHLGIGNSEITIPPEFLFFLVIGGKCQSLLRTMTPTGSPGVNRTQHSRLGVAFLSVVYTEFHFVPDAVLDFPSMIAGIDMVSKLGHI